jgi:uncharacterized protein (TIGR02453 family)
MATKTKAAFDAKLFHFLRELAVDNDRNWFNANKERYERDVRDPCLRFIADFAPRLAKVTKHAVADPRPVGGSFFRIYRDTRFSKNKTPYKTHAGIQFRHAAGKDVHAPGYYLHLEPGGCFVGAGIWHPEPVALHAIRTAIAADPKRWRSVMTQRKLTKDFTLEGESLARAPKGFDPEHPLIEDLKRKDFIAVRKLADKDVLRGDFPRVLATLFQSSSGLNAFISAALGLPW